MSTVSFHTMRHCGQSWLAQLGVSPELRARLGGWSVRGLGAMDNYTHLYIEDLRPIAEKLAEQWKAAAAVRAAELEAEDVVKRLRAQQHIFGTDPRREQHSAGISR
jgi:hypothetical protein